MTIAAGILYRGGLLMCADTEVTGWATSSHETKIGYIDRGDVNVGIACAGNVAFSMATMQHCFDHLRRAEVSAYMGIIEKVVRSHYRRLVFDHPNYANDSTLRYWHLVGLACPGSTAGLYVTEENSIREVRNFACIGIGEAIGKMVLGNCYRENLQEMEALYLAAMLLAEVKEHVPGCGGASHFLLLREDGSVITYTSEIGLGHEAFTSVEWGERYHSGYQRRANHLFLKICDPTTTKKDLDILLDEFAEYVRELITHPTVAAVRAMVDVFNGLKRVAQSDHPTPTDDPLSPSPSQESPGEKNEP